MKEKFLFREGGGDFFFLNTKGGGEGGLLLSRALWLNSHLLHVINDDLCECGQKNGINSA